MGHSAPTGIRTHTGGAAEVSTESDILEHALSKPHPKHSRLFPFLYNSNRLELPVTPIVHVAIPRKDANPLPWRFNAS